MAPPPKFGSTANRTTDILQNRSSGLSKAVQRPISRSIGLLCLATRMLGRTPNAITL